MTIVASRTAEGEALRSALYWTTGLEQNLLAVAVVIGVASTFQTDGILRIGNLLCLLLRISRWPGLVGVVGVSAADWVGRHRGHHRPKARQSLAPNQEFPIFGHSYQRETPRRETQCGDLALFAEGKAAAGVREKKIA